MGGEVAGEKRAIRFVSWSCKLILLIQQDSCATIYGALLLLYTAYLVPFGDLGNFRSHGFCIDTFLRKHAVA